MPCADTLGMIAVRTAVMGQFRESALWLLA